MNSERHRFRTNAPNVSVPAGYRDLYCDADGQLVIELPDGSKKLVSTPASQTAVATPATIGSLSRDVFVDDDTIGGAVRVVLPDPASATDAVFNVKKLGTTGWVTLVGTIDGEENLVLKHQNSTATVKSNGTTYYIL